MSLSSTTTAEESFPDDVHRCFKEKNTILSEAYHESELANVLLCIFLCTGLQRPQFYAVAINPSHKLHLCRLYQMPGRDGVKSKPGNR